MSYRKYILIVLIILIYAFQEFSDSRINYLDYCLGQKIDDNWVVEKENPETKFKYLVYHVDSNLTCRTIADTIFNLTKWNLTDNDAIQLRDKVNASLNMIADCTYISNVASIWNCYEYKWYDSIHGDMISLSKCKTEKQIKFSSWSFEIHNDSLVEYLNSNHDPYYDIRPPFN